LSVKRGAGVGVQFTLRTQFRTFNLMWLTKWD